VFKLVQVIILVVRQVPVEPASVLDVVHHLILVLVIVVIILVVLGLLVHVCLIVPIHVPAQIIHRQSNRVPRHVVLRTVLVHVGAMRVPRPVTVNTLVVIIVPVRVPGAAVGEPVPDAARRV